MLLDDQKAGQNRPLDKAATLWRQYPGLVFPQSDFHGAAGLEGKVMSDN